MSLQYRVIVGLGAAVLALGAMTFPAGAGTPALTATPNTNLVHGQSITIEGAGFVANSPFVEAVQCISGATTPSECDYFTAQSSTTDGSGDFSLSLQVKVIISVSGGPVDCRTPGACMIGGGTAFDDAANTPIEFDPNGPNPPILPPSVLAAEPSTGLVDGQVIRLSGSNYTPHVQVGFAQCVVPAATQNDCDLGTTGLQFANNLGQWSAPYTAHATITTLGHGTVDCRVVTCMIGSAELNDYTRTSGVVLSFASDVNFADHEEEVLVVRAVPRFTG